MARQLGQRGWRIAITGRREGALRETAEMVRSGGAECLELPGSVTDPGTVKEHYARIRERWGGLDWAILNAGVGDGVDARRMRAETYRAVLDTNVLGVVNWLEAVLPGMIEAGTGTVAGISSLAGWRGLPGAGAYSASKAALSALLESTRVDLQGTGVHVVTVCPGFIRNGDPGQAVEGKPFLLDLDDGARRIIAGIEARRRLVHFPWQLSLLMKYVVRNLPGSVYDWAIGKVAPQR